jgi:hypothetical protein
MASPEALAIQAAQREADRLEQLRRIDDRLARLEALLSGGRTDPAHGIDPEVATAVRREAVTPAPKPQAAGERAAKRG